MDMKNNNSYKINENDIYESCSTSFNKITSCKLHLAMINNIYKHQEQNEIDGKIFEDKDLFLTSVLINIQRTYNTLVNVDKVDNFKWLREYEKELEQARKILYKDIFSVKKDRYITTAKDIVNVILGAPDKCKKSSFEMFCKTTDEKPSICVKCLLEIANKNETNKKVYVKR